MSASDEEKFLRSAKLVWQEDDGSLRELILNEGATIHLGREKNNDIVLPSKEVSKQHATIYWQADTFMVVDQGSSNGTVVNGTQISAPTTLKDGDAVEIGEYVLSYYYLGERMIEQYKTMPLNDASLEEAAEAAVSPEAPTTRDLVENLETMVAPDLAPEVSKEAEVLEAEPEVEPEEAPAEVPAEAEEVAPQEATREAPDLDKIFAELLDQLQAAQGTAQGLREKGQSISAKVIKLASLNEQLGEVSQGMAELEAKVSEAELIAIVMELSKNPNDITLLVRLAGHAELLVSLLNAFADQGKTLGDIRQGLEDEIAGFLE